MTAIANHPHRVTSAITGVRSELSSVAEVPVWSMDPTETAEAITEITRAESQLAELKSRLLAHADRTEIAAQTGAASTAKWHAVATTTTRPAAHRLLRLATGLDTHEATRTALAAGRVQVEQAEVILCSLGELPDDLEPGLVAKAEAHLLALAVITTPRRCGSWAGGSSRSSPPRPPTPTKPSSSRKRNAPPRPRPG